MANAIEPIKNNVRAAEAEPVARPVPPLQVAKANSQSASSVAKAPVDTVQLSVTAQAKLLQQQGRTVNEIADSLGVSASTISSDLGVTVAAVKQPQLTAPISV